MKARAIATVALLGLLAGCAPSTSAASTATVTADEQRTGLSGRAEVPEGTGMLFTFAGRQERQVWMAGMQTRIDAAWIVDDQVLAVETLGPVHDDRSEHVPALDVAWRRRRTAGSPRRRLEGVPVGETVTLREDTPS